ncbi:hypothetical protein Ancab_025243 [Ancistrocladus abbreviatus]
MLEKQQDRKTEEVDGMYSNEDMQRADNNMFLRNYIDLQKQENLETRKSNRLFGPIPILIEDRLNDHEPIIGPESGGDNKETKETRMTKELE